MTRQPPFDSRCASCGEPTDDTALTARCVECREADNRERSSEGSDLAQFFLYIAIVVYLAVLSYGALHLLGVMFG